MIREPYTLLAAVRVRAVKAQIAIDKNSKQMNNILSIYDSFKRFSGKKYLILRFYKNEEVLNLKLDMYMYKPPIPIYPSILYPYYDVRNTK